MRAKKTELIPAYSPALHSALEQLAASTSAPSNASQRARMILLATDGSSSLDIARVCDVNYNNVRLWIGRFLESLPVLEQTEKENPESEALYSLLLRTLSDRRRTGSGPRFSQEQFDQIEKIYEKGPAAYGYYSVNGTWDLYNLAAEAVRQGIVEEISPTTLRRYIVKKEPGPARRAQADQ